MSIPVLANNGPLRQAAPLTVRLHVAGAGTTTACQPVAVGIPFTQGALSAAEGLTLADAQARPVPLQTAVLARWSDGSVKWALLDFLWRPENGTDLGLAVR